MPDRQRELDLFDAIERSERAREELVRRLDIDPRAKKLILEIDAAARRAGKPALPDGSREIKINARDLLNELNITKNTLTEWLKLCPTAYLEVERFLGRAHTYCVRWPAIAGCRSDSERSVGRERGTQPLGELGRLDLPNHPNSHSELGELGKSNLPNRPNSDPPNPSPRDLNPRDQIHKTPRGFDEFSGKVKGPRLPPGSWSPLIMEATKAGKSGLLNNSATVQQLYLLIVRLKIVEESEQNRLWIFSEAVHDHRVAPKERYGSPGAIFAHNIRRGEHRAINEEIDEASAMIKEVDFGTPRRDRRTDRSYPFEESDRTRQIAELQAWTKGHRSPTVE